jgi:hypothetical protein
VFFLVNPSIRWVEPEMETTAGTAIRGADLIDD